MEALAGRPIEARRARAVVGDGLLHPVPLLAIGLLIVNDHLFKQLWPGPVTGKLSDFAGLVFFPLLVQGCWEVVLALIGRPSVANRAVLLVSVAITAVSFITIKLAPGAGDLYREVLGLAQWLIGAAPAVLLNDVINSPRRVQLTADPTDLIALPALVLATAIGLRRSRTAKWT